jgi:M6 family metalloprotease-like protein
MSSGRGHPPQPGRPGYVVLGPLTAALVRCRDWFAELSGGMFAPEPVPLARRSTQVDGAQADGASDGEVGPPGGWAAYARRRQALVAALLARLDEPGRDAVAAASGLVVVVPPADAGLPPHASRMPGGGMHLGGRRWCRRYGVVPADAPLGTAAHELAHLLLRWPDLDRSGLGWDCLMAFGGHLGGGTTPAPPCAPLRVAAGWVTPVRAGPATRVADLGPGAVVAVGAADASTMVERRHDRLLVFADRPRPGLVRRVALREADHGRPLLAVLASAGLGSRGHANSDDL